MGTVATHKARRFPQMCHRINPQEKIRLLLILTQDHSRIYNNNTKLSSIKSIQFYDIKNEKRLFTNNYKLIESVYHLKNDFCSISPSLKLECKYYLP